MSRTRSKQLADVVSCYFHADDDAGCRLAIVADVSKSGALPMLSHTEVLLQMHCPCYRCGRAVDVFTDHLACGTDGIPGDFAALRVPDQFVADVRQVSNRTFQRANSREVNETRRSQIAVIGLRHSRAEVRALNTVQGGRCFYCFTELLSDARGSNVAEDDFVPLARGGHDGIANIVLSCRPCNNSKLAKDGFRFAWAAEDAAPDELRVPLMEMHRRHRKAYPELWSAARGRRRPRRAPR
jgi:5-methylcytosine-specific restriction endonuclease McrA